MSRFSISEYISTNFFDDNGKRPINGMLVVLMGVWTLTSTSSFDTQSLQFDTTTELKKSMPGGLYLFFGSSIQFLLSVGTGGYFTQCQCHVCRKIRQMYLSIVQAYFSVKVTHNLRIALINNALPKSFFIDFIHFKSCF